MNRHPKEEMLSAWIDGEVTFEESQAIHDHLSDCAACQSLVSELTQASDTLASLRSVTPPPSLLARLKEDWESRWGQLASKKSLGSFALFWTPALVAAAILLTIAPSIYRSDPPVPSGNRLVSSTRSSVKPVLPTLVPPTDLKNNSLRDQVASAIGEVSPFFLTNPDSFGLPNEGAISTTAENPFGAEKPRVPFVAEPSRTRSNSPLPCANRSPLHFLKNRVEGEESLSSRKPDIPEIPETDPSSSSFEISGPEALVATNTSPAAHDPAESNTDPAPASAGPAQGTTNPGGIQVASAAGNGDNNQRVMELVVEDDPNPQPPPPPRRSSCEWSVRNHQTGVVKGGTITRHYDPSGEVQSVAMSVVSSETSDTSEIVVSPSSGSAGAAPEVLSPAGSGGDAPVLSSPSGSGVNAPVVSTNQGSGGAAPTVSTPTGSGAGASTVPSPSGSVGGSTGDGGKEQNEKAPGTPRQSSVPADDLYSRDVDPLSMGVPVL